MDQQNQEVENKVQEASPEQRGVDSGSQAPENDPEAKLKALTEELNKVTRDRDNYRSATLALKGKKEADELDLADPIQLQAYIDKKLDDRMLSSQEDASRQELIRYAEQLAKKNKELAIAVANRSQIAPASVGSGESETTSKGQQYFSQDQVNAMKHRWKLANIPETKWDGMLKAAEEKMKNA